jgi:hypothetical protein
MKTKYTFIIAAALVAAQLTGCKSTQTFTNNSFVKPINFSGMGNNNTCNLNNSTRAERKYLAYYDYCESLKKSYTDKSQLEVDNNAVGAGAAYMLITGGK